MFYSAQFYYSNLRPVNAIPEGQTLSLLDVKSYIGIYPATLDCPQTYVGSRDTDSYVASAAVGLKTTRVNRPHLVYWRQRDVVVKELSVLHEHEGVPPVQVGDVGVHHDRHEAGAGQGLSGDAAEAGTRDG